MALNSLTTMEFPASGCILKIDRNNHRQYSPSFIAHLQKAAFANAHLAPPFAFARCIRDCCNRRPGGPSCNPNGRVGLFAGTLYVTGIHSGKRGGKPTFPALVFIRASVGW